jgi:hypothetical protein
MVHVAGKKDLKESVWKKTVCLSNQYAAWLNFATVFSFLLYVPDSVSTEQIPGSEVTRATEARRVPNE